MIGRGLRILEIGRESIQKSKEGPAHFRIATAVLLARLMELASEPVSDLRRTGVSSACSASSPCLSVMRALGGSRSP